MADTSKEAASTQKSGVGFGIRIVISLVIAFAMAAFILLWDGGYIPSGQIPTWVGPYVFLPLLGMILGFGGSTLIQSLSCGKVQWSSQLKRIAVVPVPFVIMWGFFQFVPGMRWPIEGLVQGSTPQMQKGLSSGFYTFWLSMYIQSIMNGLSQLC